MLRQGGGRILQSARSSSAGSSSHTAAIRSLSPHAAVLPPPSSPSHQPYPWPSNTSSSSSTAAATRSQCCTIYTKCGVTTTTSSSSSSERKDDITRRWKSNLHKRAAQALGKNNNMKSIQKEESPKPPSSIGDSSSSSSSSAADPQNGKATIPASNNKPSSSESASPKITPPPPPLGVGHLHEFAPRIVVVGVGGGGGNAVNNMIANQLHGVDFLTLNTDAQHLSTTLTDNRIQIGSTITSGLGCGANPEAGRLAAEESREQITDLLSDAHMVFITAGMGGGTGTGAAPVVAEVCYNLGILTVGVVTKPFRFEGTQRMRLADEGIMRLREVVDTLIVIPNQNLFHLANDQTSFVDSFAMADNVLLAGVKSITDLMTTPGLINLDFADVQSVMSGMGNAILGTGQSSFDDLPSSNGNGSDAKKKKQTERAVQAAEMALANPLLGSDMDIGTAKGMLVNITGGKDMTLFEVDRAAQLITERVRDDRANIIFGSAYDETLDGSVRVSVVATGIEEMEVEDEEEK